MLLCDRFTCIEKPKSWLNSEVLGPPFSTRCVTKKQKNTEKNKKTRTELLTRNLTYMYTVRQKTAPFYFCRNFFRCWPIFVIISLAEEICNKVCIKYYENYEKHLKKLWQKWNGAVFLPHSVLTYVDLFIFIIYYVKRLAWKSKKMKQSHTVQQIHKITIQWMQTYPTYAS